MKIAKLSWSTEFTYVRRVRVGGRVGEAYIVLKGRGERPIHTHREEYQHPSARDAPQRLVYLPPPALGLVDVEEERESVDAPVVVAHELAVVVRRVVPQLLAQADQDRGEERGHADRPAVGVEGPFLLSRNFTIDGTHCPLSDRC